MQPSDQARWHRSVVPPANGVFEDPGPARAVLVCRGADLPADDVFADGRDCGNAPPGRLGSDESEIRHGEELLACHRRLRPPPNPLATFFTLLTKSGSVSRSKMLAAVSLACLAARLCSHTLPNNGRRGDRAGRPGRDATGRHWRPAGSGP